MKRDMDLIRELLLKLEALELRPGTWAHITGDDPEIAIDGFSGDQIEYHLRLLKAAGLLDSSGSQPMVGVGFKGLSWEGHDFLDSIRSPAVWRQTKNGVEAAGGFTVDLLKDLAKGFIKKQIEDYTGVKI